MTIIGRKIIRKARAAEGGDHVLRIISLFDAQAECSCGGWYYASPGQKTRKEIQEQFNLHSKRNSK